MHMDKLNSHCAQQSLFFGSAPSVPEDCLSPSALLLLRTLVRSTTPSVSLFPYLYVLFRKVSHSPISSKIRALFALLSRVLLDGYFAQLMSPLEACENAFLMGSDSTFGQGSGVLMFFSDPLFEPYLLREIFAFSSSASLALPP